MSVIVRFGPYELVHRLGTGGMAETFLAVRRGPAGFEQRVCVKRILPAYEADPEFVEQFLEEARLAARLRHANITQVIDFGEVGGSHYLALELVDGMDLRALLRHLGEKGQRLDPSLAVFIGLELASALAFAHQGGPDRPPLVHRDISPSNVLVSREGEVYLTDFGIARAVGVKRRTASGVVRGKVPYMAPEYAMTGELDPRADLFAVGVVLFEALAGCRPFDGKTDLDTLTRIKDGRHEPLLRLAPNVPPALAVIVERLIEVSPDARFPTARALMDALAALSPPPMIGRLLGELVRSSGGSLSHSLRLSGILPTAAISHEPAPSYPDVRPSAPDAATRTAHVHDTFYEPRPAGGVVSGFGATDPERRSPATETPGIWKVTDPTQISHHDRPSPFAPSAHRAAFPSTQDSLPVVPLARTQLMGDSSAAPSALSEPGIPAAPSAPATSAPPAARGRGCLWAALIVLGLVAFVLATAGTYFVVQALRAGGV